MKYINVITCKIKTTNSIFLHNLLLCVCVCFYACLHICHQEGAGLAVRVVTCIQTLCDMIRNSIYRCYGIIATIKEVFHLPNDLRLASQDTENDLMAMSFTVQRLRRNACVCMCMTAAVCVPVHGRSLHIQCL